MKSCATGLSVRFFRLIIPTGARACCSFTGKTVISGLLENLNTEVCIRKKAPGRHEIEPRSGLSSEDRYARIVETAGAEDVQISRPHDAFRRWQHPRFVDQLSKGDAAPANPRASGARHDDQ